MARRSAASSACSPTKSRMCSRYGIHGLRLGSEDLSAMGSQLLIFLFGDVRMQGRPQTVVAKEAYGEAKKAFAKYVDLANDGLDFDLKKIEGPTN
eukprot:scaffold5438_cov237-Pinguiococcus_pyrenoidosus.AAC.3